jgi:hypothetical protein
VLVSVGVGTKVDQPELHIELGEASNALLERFVDRQVIGILLLELVPKYDDSSDLSVIKRHVNANFFLLKLDHVLQVVIDADMN